MDNEKSPLYIPMGLREEAEFFPGFGKVELFKALGIVALFVVADVLLYAIFQSIEAVIIVLVLGVAMGVGLFVRDASNNSIADRFADMLRFTRCRKRYDYIGLDEWRNEP